MFKVAELDELLHKKGKIVKGRKEQKAMEVAWCYTKEEIATWRRQRQDLEPPALLVNRDNRAKTLDDQKAMTEGVTEGVTAMTPGTSILTKPST